VVYVVFASTILYGAFHKIRLSHTWFCSKTITSKLCNASFSFTLCYIRHFVFILQMCGESNPKWHQVLGDYLQPAFGILPLTIHIYERFRVFQGFCLMICSRSDYYKPFFILLAPPLNTASLPLYYFILLYHLSEMIVPHIALIRTLFVF